MLSLAIGKEGQNARLAAKLTGWRIDIRSAVTPDMEQENVEMDDDELARRAVAALRAEAVADGDPSGGFQPPAVPDGTDTAPREERRKVRPNNTVVYQSATYGPLPEQLPGETVRLRISDGDLQVRTDSGRVLATYPLQESGDGKAEDEEEG